MKLAPKKVLLDIANENNLLNESTQSNHGQTFSPYNLKARLERQVSNFRRQHIEGNHDAGKQRTIKPRGNFWEGG